jgi:hypothetical protein
MGVGTVATIEEILLPFAKEIASIDFESQGFNVTFRHWQEALGPAKTQDLEAALGRFSNRITRADLFELARECAKRPNDLPLHRQAFLGVMLWGYGHTPRWGPERVARILAARQFDDALLTIQQYLAVGRLEESYRRPGGLLPVQTPVGVPPECRPASPWATR